MCLGLPGRLEHVTNAADPLQRTGVVDFDGIRRSVALALVPEAVVGDFLLVHAGVAIQVVEREEAARVLAWLGEIEP